MIILSVKSLGTGKRRFHVHFLMKDEEMDMPLYGGEMRRYHIEEGAELPDSVYEQIVNQVLKTRIITRCEYLLNGKAYTVAELRKKLQEGYYPSDLIEMAIEKMLAWHFLDDEDYARRYVELRGKKKSLRELTLELRRKGIDRDLIEDVLAGGEEQQSDTLMRLAEKRCKNENLEDPKIWMKHLRYFMGKGFPYDEICDILSSIK